jgi:transposase
MRSRIVLAAADGLGNTAIADKLDIHITSARKWRSRFVADRLESLLDKSLAPPRELLLGEEVRHLRGERPGVLKQEGMAGVAVEHQDGRI